MKFFFLFLGGIFIALFFDVSLSLASFSPIPFPMVLLWTMIGMSESKRPSRFFLAGGAGIFMDTFSLLPFGTYTSLFFLLVFFPEFLSPLVAAVRPIVQKIVIVTASLGFFFLCIYPVANILETFSHHL